ncbi:unnamed protein product [Clonostachys rhizophaga]|uniref:non-specific serine/threonine protein kinase n=1 Tax=Clonostachys rhizophaga TaxID=160324 RepID=A0A9N9VZS1_9HYPO|nr:unnamed protein product [Clonostachys rhizophaga]
MIRRRRPRGQGSPPQKLLLAVAFLLVPWLQLADAQAREQPRAAIRPHHDDVSGSRRSLHDDSAIQALAVTKLSDVDPALKTAALGSERPSFDKVDQLHAAHLHRRDTRSKRLDKSRQHSAHSDRNSKQQPNIHIPSDASALATLAPDQSVRAPHPSRHQKPSSAAASGLVSPHVARSLEDWEVEDFVLLATVDGDLYASDRKTLKERWHLEVDQPMVETKHHRSNSSILDEDFSAIDHYIWAVEPTRDGGLFVWVPDSDAGLIRTGFTMKRLVEELAPFADDRTSVVYTGDKKTTLITLDAATGKVLKWFGSGGSHVNEAESCLRPNTLYNMDMDECSSTGTITLGRTEYTVGIQRRDGKALATIKYSEWGPNNFDHDLLTQYHSSLDSRYFTSRHDGKVYAFDPTRNELPSINEKFATPVARVFDVCRPWDAPTDSNPELVVLPQPPMPSRDEDIARIRSQSIFLNRTSTGSWYAMSGRSYPLIIDAPMAPVSNPDWLDNYPPLDTLDHKSVSKALVGTHVLEASQKGSWRRPSLPSGESGHEYLDGEHNESENESPYQIEVSDSDDASLLNKVKSLPQHAATSLIDFVKNPTLIIIFIALLIYNENKIRRSYHQMKENGFSVPFDWFGKETDQSLSPDKYGESDLLSNANIACDEPQIIGAENQTTTPEAIPKIREPIADQSSNDSDRTTPEQARLRDNAADQGLEVPNADGEAASPGGKKKKAHRGRRGGVKHRKKPQREGSQSRDDEPGPKTVDDAVTSAKKLGEERQKLEPDVMTVAPSDMQGIGNPVIRMGNIEVNTEDQLGTGSNGTLVFAGKFDGRDVAVKRMLIHFYDIAVQETKLLRESDDHPNVIRYYSQQVQDGFLYIALEKCAASLAEVVEKPHIFRDLANAGRQDLPAILYQITNGINHLHSLRIVHRDLKPQNILVNMGKDGRPRMLVSDFGLCKKLEGGQSSFGATTGRAAGTSGWRAPELLLDDDARDAGLVDLSSHSVGSGSVLVMDGMNQTSRRATRAIDIFSLGLVFYYVLTNGSHPFDCGDRYMREVNIRKGNFNLHLLDSLGDFAYEAKDLIGSMLAADPKQRPPAREVMAHPFFWSAKKRLAFLCDVSDHFEKECRDPPSEALQELERHASQVTRGDFLRQLPREFVDSLGKQRKYTGTRLLDLLRALRNKRNHYEDMPDSLKRTVGPLPDGYLSFWTTKFPMLLLDCWNVVYNVRWEETDRFREYYEPAGL